MVEEPERFPDQVDLAKLRESKEALATLRRETDAMANAVRRERESIDERLAAVVENFAPERIDPVDRAILRLATWEILHDPEVPAPVAINEAIELAKRFGTTDSGRFVNGILDKIAKEKADAGS
jgi:N utilization substance protein B